MRSKGSGAKPVTDAEIVELALLYAASKVGDPTKYGLIQAANEIARLIAERKANSGAQPQSELGVKS